VISRYGPTYGYLDLFKVAAEENAAESLRSELARLHNVRHAFLFESARAALHFLLRAYGKSGGEVVMPGYTCVVVPEWVAAAGYAPVFADIGRRSVNMTSETLSRVITPRTEAVVITHQFGVPCDVHELIAMCRDRGILAVEDAAAAFGATVEGVPVGSFGDAAVVSFYHTKVISAGSGGALLTNNDELAERVKNLLRAASASRTASWRAFWSAALWKVAHSRPAYPALRYARAVVLKEDAYDVVTPQSFANLQPRPCSDYATALFRRQLNRLEENLANRRRSAEAYRRALAGVPGFELPDVPENARPAWIQYPVFTRGKFDLSRYALRRSVDLSWTFRYCAAESYGVTDCVNSMRAARTVVGLPTHPGMSDAAVGRVCSVLREYAAQGAPLRASMGAKAV
jgi:perosamine synthetase